MNYYNNYVPEPSLFEFLLRSGFIHIAGIILFVALLFFLFRIKAKVLDHWHFTYDGLNFSTQEFYALAQQGIQSREIPKLTFGRTTYREIFLFGQQREYLRIYRGDYVFDICAAPFGKGMYVSWWLVEETSLAQRIFRRLPLISFFYSVRTYHQIDSEMMFRDLVHMAVQETIETVTTAKGARRLTESERAIRDFRTMPLKVA
jgi:hypothetical protein